MKKDAFDVPPSNYNYTKHHDTPKTSYWICAMFGTAVGAGILYLPVQAGICNIWSLIVASIFVFPTIYFSHKAIAALLTSSRLLRDYSGTINRYMGVTFGFFFNIVFFLTWFTVLLMYSIGLNENGGVFLQYIGITKSNLADTLYLSLIILIALFAMIKFCKKALLKIMSSLSVLLIIFLIGISIYLIPYWSFKAFEQPVSISAVIVQVLIIIP